VAVRCQSAVCARNCRAASAMLWLLSWLIFFFFISFFFSFLSGFDLERKYLFCTTAQSEGDRSNVMRAVRCSTARM
jgi:hypothetical protein